MIPAQPTYFHLHVHFTHLSYKAPGSGVEKAHLLPTVISNIAREGSNFYGRATLPFAVKESDKLYQGGQCHRYAGLGTILNHSYSAKLLNNL